ncbi:hypothetical protein HJC23_011866 [Cyclotella cryptica]|uniref:Uncharacterized protein n=1 Tax=Cyclotella cryptica TaxID=29204 RepID=A0ABD3QEM6_9STRA|eukprot:CCRYP_006176-RA/>CCRYP_006176-RA protein AED:0.29 eAED:0.29 QI:0/-1/0/1/-1/1/1/0/419
MSLSARFYLATACSAAMTASAFRSSSTSSTPFVPTSHTSRDHCFHAQAPLSPRTNDVSMSYFPYNYGPYDYDYPEPYPPPRFTTTRTSSHPLFSTSAEQALDQAVDAQVVFEDNDRDQNDNDDDDAWIPDRERTKKGEVINFDPENPVSKPLKNAAAYPSDLYDHPTQDNYFQKRANHGPSMRPDVDYEGRDLSQLHRETQHMNEEYYAQRPSVRRPPPVARRNGPTMYTPEEEELIAAMGGRGRRNTQEFAGTRTPNGREIFEPPLPPPMGVEGNNFFDGNDPFGGGEQFYREEGYLGDSTLKEISMDYSVPICYLADVVASWGVPVPIDPLGRLGDMVTGEQAFAMLEAIHTLDIAALHDRYSEDNLMNICDYYEIDLKEAFDFAMRRGWALPFGVRTFLRVEQEEELLEALGRDVY